MSEDSSSSDVTPRDALAVAQRALAKANRVDDLEDQLEELTDELARMQLRLSEFDDDRPYDALTRDDKVGMVREHAFEKAQQGTGVSALDYDDIKWEVFDGEPSADHCYTLMQLAADVGGFDVEDPAKGNRRLTVDATSAKRSLAFSSANKTPQEEVN